MVFALAVLAVLAAAACSSGEEADGTADSFESGRTRPTDQSEHDHSGEASALAPETVLPEDVAELGRGVGEGESMDLWVGLNICGRFVELPVTRSDLEEAAAGGLSIDESGAFVLSHRAEFPHAWNYWSGLDSEEFPISRLIRDMVAPEQELPAEEANVGRGR